MLRVPRRLSPLFLILLLSQCMTGANAPNGDAGDQARAFTRFVEFNYLSWTLDAVLVKLEQISVGADRYLDEEQQSDLVRNYMTLIQEIQIGEAQLGILHANPDAQSVAAQIEDLNVHLGELYSRRTDIAPLVENILQSQVTAIAAKLGLTVAGRPVPPVLFHSTPLPWALIASPRSAIYQEANISLETNLTLDDHIALEERIESAQGLAALVVPVGGVGTYPTMVAQSSHLNWLAEVIAHEWTHNFLTLRPLGLLYSQSPELTTMNETTANISGREIGALVIERFYPELVPAPPAPASAEASQSALPPAAPVFDFRAEMHITRIQVDALLAEGKVEEAEEYMEARRLIFWEQGYAIRKLNQAYFAFYGSYADAPVGAAGEDPVGAAVRELRMRSASLDEFIQYMAPLTSFQDLLDLLASLD